MLDRVLCHRIETRDARELSGAVAGEPSAFIATGLGPRAPAVFRIVHVQLSHDGVRIALIGDRWIDHLAHEDSLAGMGGDSDPAVAAPGFLLGESHERSAPAIAEEHNRLRLPTTHFGDCRGDVDHTGLVQTIGVVVHVARTEAEGGVARGGQERTGIVHGEIAAGVGEHDGGLPAHARRWGPQDAAHEGSVGGDQANGLATDRHFRLVLGQGPVAKAERTMGTQRIGHGAPYCSSSSLTDFKNTGCGA